jgi:small subunit ribosomal protein S18
VSFVLIRANAVMVLQVRREMDYKNIPLMMNFVGKQGAILGRRKGHIRAVTQRKVARAVKNARQMALMPHVGVHPAYADEMTLACQEAFDKLQAQALAARH